MPTFKVFKNKKTKRKKTKKKHLFFDKYIYKNKVLSGGKAIMYGSVGCVFSPSIKCETSKREESIFPNESYVSKMLLPEEAKVELESAQRIKQILKDLNPNFKKYVPLLSQYSCNNFNVTESDIENISICKNVKGFKNVIDVKNFEPSLFKQFSIINMVNAGIDLFEYTKEIDIRDDKISYENLEKAILLLTECIFSINKYGIFHCDIKVENITYNKKNNHFSLIDFGRSVIINNDTSNFGDKIPFDFNILPHIIFFHSDFPVIKSKEQMYIALHNKFEKSTNRDVMLRYLSDIFSIKRENIIKVISVAMYDTYLNLNLHLPENRNRYFHEVFKYNIDIWSMFIVLYNLLSKTKYSQYIKSIAKDFFENCFYRPANYNEIEKQLRIILQS